MHAALDFCSVSLKREGVGKNDFNGPSSLCQRLGLLWSVRNKPRARSASVEREARVSSAEGARPPEAKDERSESFAGGARFLREGANTKIKC